MTLILRTVVGGKSLSAVCDNVVVRPHQGEWFLRSGIEWKLNHLVTSNGDVLWATTTDRWVWNGIPSDDDGLLAYLIEQKWRLVDT